VFVRSGKYAAKFLVIAALVLTTGAQWTVLQSVAWVGMIVRYSETAPLKVALADTFDGKHPCCLCKAIAAAKKAGQKSAIVPATHRLEFPPFKEGFVLAVPSRFQLLRPTNSFADSLTHKPLAPPPRRLFA
jgi:hypothetical protein